MELELAHHGCYKEKPLTSNIILHHPLLTCVALDRSSCTKTSCQTTESRCAPRKSWVTRLWWWIINGWKVNWDVTIVRWKVNVSDVGLSHTSPKVRCGKLLVWVYVHALAYLEGINFMIFNRKTNVVRWTWTLYEISLCNTYTLYSSSCRLSCVPSNLSLVFLFCF